MSVVISLIFILFELNFVFEDGDVYLSPGK